MTSPSVRIGVIGLGNIGTAHANALYENKVPSGTLSAICDLSEERRSYAREHFPKLPVFADAGELFSSGLVDAVIVAVPHKDHARLCLEALQHKLHALSEKPIDISVTKAMELNQAFAASDRVFGIMFNQRTDPLFQKAREIVQGGALGELKRSVWIITNWYRDQAYYDSGQWRATWSGEGGGVLLNQAPHNLDLWQWICGMPVSVKAQCLSARYHHIEVEDDASLLVRYENGASGVFITSTGEYPGTNRLEISGSKGKLVLEQGKMKWWKLPHDERDFCFGKAPRPHTADVEYEEIDFPVNHGGHAKIIENFCQAILFDTPLLAPGYDGICQLTLSNAAYLSQWTGQEIHFPMDTALFDLLLAKKAACSKENEKNEKENINGEYKDRWQVNW